MVDAGILTQSASLPAATASTGWDTLPYLLREIVGIGGPILLLLVFGLVLLGIWIWRVAPERERRRAEELALKNKTTPPAPTMEEIRTTVESLSKEITKLRSEVVYPSDCAECKQNMERERERYAEVLHETVDRLDEGMTYLRNRLDALNDYLLSSRKK